MTTRYFNDKEYKVATNYILLNCDEVESCLSKYTMELRTRFPSLIESDLQMRISDEFSMWFRKEIYLTPKPDSDNLSIVPACPLATTVAPSMTFAGGLVLWMKMIKRSNGSSMKKRMRKSFNRSPIPKHRMFSCFYTSRNVYSSGSDFNSSGDLDSISAATILEFGAHVYSFGFICYRVLIKACSSLSTCPPHLHSFNKQSDSAKVITEIMKAHFIEAHLSLGKKKYRWDPMHEHAIWDAWQKQISLQYKGFMYERKKMGKAFAQSKLYVLLHQQKGQWIDTRSDQF
ncbi:hypothetical protein M9H77_07413 [Catharanthus roseus]|uniref:Uncharacterized protein n=1 Tax=Catharanthus roseus TaxID=4058 RepID=A0ACC0BUW5_CATRO|nr:hypothetical protein M9H77_07413 [Catharanthus roseus]